MFKQGGRSRFWAWFESKLQVGVAGACGDSMAVFRGAKGDYRLVSHQSSID